MRSLTLGSYTSHYVVGDHRVRSGAIDAVFAWHEFRVMTRGLKNVTITLDEETASRARVEAARRNISVSKLLGEINPAPSLA